MKLNTKMKNVCPKKFILNAGMIIIFLFIWKGSTAQANLDSLQAELSETDDIEMVARLNLQLCKTYLHIDNQKALSYCLTSVSHLTENELSNSKFLPSALLNTSLSYHLLDDAIQSKQYVEKAWPLIEDPNDMSLATHLFGKFYEFRNLDSSEYYFYENNLPTSAI